MAKCLVLGADGFLGSHLVDGLIAKGHQVRAFDRVRNEQPRNLDLATPNLEFFSGNFLNRQDLQKAVTDMDYVFHYISTTNPATSSQDPFIDIDTNIRMSVELFRICNQANVKKVIFPSTGGAVYGRHQEKPFMESDLAEPISPYAIGKLAIEGFMRYFNRSHNLPFLALRIANPYGERQNVVGSQGVIPIFLNKIRQDLPITVYGDGSMVRDYIYVDDLTNIVTQIFDQPQRHYLYNVGSGQKVSVNDLIAVMAKVTGKTPIVDRQPMRPTDIAQSVMHTKRLTDEFKVVAETSLEDGIRKTWSYVQGLEPASA